jgi:hypothetical protein
MKIILLILIFINVMFADSENISMMNAVKNQIQKEEYISLAINKYILQTATIPKKDDNSLYWDKLKTNDYLGANFNTTNPITSSELKVTFDSNNNAYIQGIIEKTADYSADKNYLYNFYVNNIFRVNTIPPTNITKEKLLIGSQIKYNDIQKEIVALLNKNEKIKFPNEQQVCTANSYYYELRNSKLTYKYCKSDNNSFDVYQEEPIYAETSSDLNYVRANIGTKAYVRNSDLSWSEKYFTGYNDTDGKSEWTNSSTVSEPSTDLGDDENIQDKILSYIPNSKDLMLRRDGGCMLANGDIFCWGNNQYKKAGVENYGQLDNTLKPYFVNTPVMLKVQIDSTKIGNIDPNSIKWYNNPYRIKFQKMAMNSTNVCAISPIFTNSASKYGGDLYCNGKITSTYYENIATASSETSILSKNKYIADKTKGMYLTQIAMVEDTIAVLSDAGKIYTIGKNYLGALGKDITDKFIVNDTASEVTSSGQIFKKIFALRDLKTFGAIDSNNQFYIWGERPNGTVYYKPSLIGSGKKFDLDAIFTNSKEFLLKGLDGVFYRTNNDLTVTAISSSNIPSDAISASIYDHSDGTTSYIYINDKLELKGSDTFLTCKETDGTTNCDTTDSPIFNASLSELNTKAENGYASFANISIYQLDTIKTETVDTFENGVSTWKLKTYSDTKFSKLTHTQDPKVLKATETSADTVNSRVTERVDPTYVLAGQTKDLVWNKDYGSNYYGLNLGHQSLEKTYEMGSEYANDEVEIEFDFYEIDTWDMERFQILLNDILVSEDGFIHDCHDQFTETNDTGIYTLSLGKHYKDDLLNGKLRTCNDKSSNLYGLEYSRFEDEKYTYKFKGKLDGNGKLKVVFRVRNLDSGEYGWTTYSVGQPINDESWAIDNVRIKVKETSKTFVCAMTGFSSSSQMYCWGNVGRSIPIVNTSLYDVNKSGVGTMNKLFISQESDKISPMSYDDYNNSGNLWLKYPTYIGGFDYPFYFR